MSGPIFTIGHSNHSAARFLELLRESNIETVVDVRSQPMSRWVPHFNKAALRTALKGGSIGYVFMGSELGGRPDDPALRTQGKPDYGAMAQARAFRAAIERLIELSKDQRIALMCAERDPLDCHRFLLIGRELVARGRSVANILSDGIVEDVATTQRRAAKLHPRLL